MTRSADAATVPLADTLGLGEALNSQLMDALAEGVFVAQDFQLVFANPALAALLGREHASITTLPFGQFIPGELHDDWVERYCQRIGPGPEPQRRYETRLLHADGQTRIDVEIGATRTRYAGRPAVLGVVRGIGERLRLRAQVRQNRADLEAQVVARTAELRAAMAALQHSEQILRQRNAALADAEAFTRDIADNLPVRIAYWDRDLRCRFVNRACCDWFGMPAERVLGRSHDDLLSGHDLADARPRLALALQGQAQEFAHEHPTVDGAPARSLVHLLPERNGGDDAQGVLMLVIDVTPQWQAQRALELLNDELVVARDSAESAGRAKSAFLANMSHEMRTPMNAIIGLTHLLRRDSADAAQRDRLGRIGDAAHHLLHIINNVLDLSKIEAGKAAVEATTFDVSQMLRAACAMVEDKARAKGLAFTVDGAALPRQAVGDPARIAQALTHLVDNAVKFTHAGGVEVLGSVLDSGPAGTLLRLEVRDTGIGIAPAKLERLFTAFEQAESAASRRFGGTGLGLSLTRKLARLMGGDAGAVSEPGRGSTFWVTVRVGAADVAAGAAAMPDAALFLRRAHAGARVLVVDDNAINREVAVSLLQGVALCVDIAEDGQGAIDQAARNDYALILMDLQMPGVDGLEASRAIRKLPNAKGAALAIVAMTAHAFPEDRATVLAAGMNDYLGKPVEPQTLYATVARWLGPAQVASPQARLQRLAAVEGLDVQRGMAFFAGRPEPYLQALGTFVRLYTAGWAGVGVDDATARRELHGTGSACASVGAADLAAFAHDLLGHARAAADATRPAVPAAGLAAFAERLGALSARIAQGLDA